MELRISFGNRVGGDVWPIYMRVHSSRVNRFISVFNNTRGFYRSSGHTSIPAFENSVWKCELACKTNVSGKTVDLIVNCIASNAAEFIVDVEMHTVCSYSAIMEGYPVHKYQSSDTSVLSIMETCDSCRGAIAKDKDPPA